MPPVIQTSNFFSAGLVGGAFEALTPGTGDSATFFDVPTGSPAYIGEVWAVNDASPMQISLTASRFHDNTRGIVASVVDGSTTAPVNQSQLLSPAGLDQPIYPSDVLTVWANGVAADNVNVCIQKYYSDVPGLSARLISYDAVKGRLKNLVGITCTVTPGAGDYGTSVALNATDNRLHSGADYAVLGFTSQTPIAVLTLSGVDTGNLRVGGPVLAEPRHDAYLFADLARAYNQPLIPVIAANNAGSISVQAADTAAGARTVDVMLAELI